MLIRHKPLAMEAMRVVAAAGKADLEAVVQDWKTKNKPIFTLKERYELQGWQLLIENGDIFNLVDAGSPPHIIKPKNFKTLKFPSGQYIARTLPRQLMSISTDTMKSGEQYVGGQGLREQSFEQAKIVHHPGFKAREWREALHKRYNKKGTDAVRAALKEAMQELQK